MERGTLLFLNKKIDFSFLILLLEEKIQGAAFGVFSLEQNELFSDNSEMR